MRLMTEEKLRILVISNYLPSPFGGSSHFMLDFLTYLRSKGINVEYILLNPNSSMLLRKPVRHIIRVKSPYLLFRLGPLLLWRNPADVIVKIANRLNFRINILQRLVTNKHWSSPPTISDLIYISHRLQKFKPHVIIADYAWMAEAFDCVRIDRRVVKVIFAHDVIHLRSKRFADQGILSDVPAWTADEEIKKWTKADLILVETDEEGKVIKELLPEKDVLVMPKAWHLIRTDDNQVKGRCLFVGGSSPHNVSGLRWFLTEVWPLVLNKVPFASLHVVGDVCRHFSGNKYPNVRFLGKVENVSSEYSRAQVCIVPLLAGTGFKIKLGEALAHGRACVCTSIGAMGAEKFEGKAFLVADTKHKFADYVCELIENDWKRQEIESGARSFIETELSPEAVYIRFIERVYKHLA